MPIANLINNLQLQKQKEGKNNLFDLAGNINSVQFKAISYCHLEVDWR